MLLSIVGSSRVIVFCVHILVSNWGPAAWLHYSIEGHKEERYFSSSREMFTFLSSLMLCSKRNCVFSLLKYWDNLLNCLTREFIAFLV